jgi:glycerol-3-phosphate responsive antiterminator
MRMIKNEALNNMINFELIQKLTEQNKSIESFLNSNIKMDIVSYNQNSLKLSNHMDIYYILSVLGSKERACDSILKDSNNIDIKEFIKNNCEKEKN